MLTDGNDSQDSGERKIEQAIEAVEGEISKVSEKIEKVEMEIEVLDEDLEAAQETGDKEKIVSLMKAKEKLEIKEQQLRKEKEQLRKKEEQLREEKLLVARRGERRVNQANTQISVYSSKMTVPQE